VSIKYSSFINILSFGFREAGFLKLQQTSDEECHSLLKKHLTREIFDKLKTVKTPFGATLMDVIQSGVKNLDSSVGVYAPDADSYSLFADLFDPIINEHHGGFAPNDLHPPKDFGDLDTFVNVDPDSEFIISTNLECRRSLKGMQINHSLFSLPIIYFKQIILSIHA
jgi:arginine kinase